MFERDQWAVLFLLRKHWYCGIFCPSDVADNFLTVFFPFFSYPHQFLTLVFFSPFNRYISFLWKISDNQIDCLFWLKGSLTDFCLRYAAFVIEIIIIQNIDNQQSFHKHSVAFSVFVIQCKLLISKFTIQENKSTIMFITSCIWSREV